MNFIYHKLPFIIELILNGIFILVYSFVRSKNVPSFLTREMIDSVIAIAPYSVPFTLVLVSFLNYKASISFEDFFRKYIFSIIVIVPLLIVKNDILFCYWLSIVHLFSSSLSIYERNPKTKVRKHHDMGFFYRLKLKPTQFVLASFLGLILIGSFLLVLPVAAAPGKSISLIDAIFTSTSASCVTGLSTLSVIDNFSIFGQIVILVLIQVGGLGIMTLNTSLTLFLGKALGMKHQLVMQDLLDVSSFEDLLSLVIDIIKYTLIIELWGGILLTIAFSYEGMEFSQAIYYGFFHSVSAFCNAGFALFSNSLENYSTNSFVQIVISILIVLGGVGFIVIKEMKTHLVERKRLKEWSLHSKIVLSITGFLIAFGAIMIFFSEFLHAIDKYTLWEKLELSLFHSITLRTAGFNSIPMNDFNAHTLYLMTLFMFIGASPGSTGGGIKTTTFAILVQSVRATMKGRENVEFFNRAIPQNLVVKAISIVMISLVIVTGFIYTLMSIETTHSFITLLFEAISAFATVGLSLGVTPYLTIAGKAAIIVLMFIGRVGPLTIALALGQREQIGGGHNYPNGRVMIG